MAYVPVPKDLTKVKTKVALNLTKRQLIFFSLAAVVGIPFYLVMRKPIGSSFSSWQCMKKTVFPLKKRWQISFDRSLSVRQ